MNYSYTYWIWKEGEKEREKKKEIYLIILILNYFYCNILYKIKNEYFNSFIFYYILLYKKIFYSLNIFAYLAIV